MGISNKQSVAIVGVSAALILASVAFSAATQWRLETTTIQVAAKERLTNITSSDGNTRTTYENFVYTNDETYVVADSFWNWHFRARTVWAAIPEDGGICQVTLSGVRWGFFSMHQNIIAADCSEEDQ